MDYLLKTKHSSFFWCRLFYFIVKTTHKSTTELLSLSTLPWYPLTCSTSILSFSSPRERTVLNAPLEGCLFHLTQGLIFPTPKHPLPISHIFLHPWHQYSPLFKGCIVLFLQSWRKTSLHADFSFFYYLFFPFHKCYKLSLPVLPFSSHPLFPL